MREAKSENRIWYFAPFQQILILGRGFVFDLKAPIERPAKCFLAIRDAPSGKRAPRTEPGLTGRLFCTVNAVGSTLTANWSSCHVLLSCDASGAEEVDLCHLPIETL